MKPQPLKQPCWRRFEQLKKKQRLPNKSNERLEMLDIFVVSTLCATVVLGSLVSLLSNGLLHGSGHHQIHHLSVPETQHETEKTEHQTAEMQHETVKNGALHRRNATLNVRTRRNFCRRGWNQCGSCFASSWVASTSWGGWVLESRSLPGILLEGW